MQQAKREETLTNVTDVERQLVVAALCYEHWVSHASSTCKLKTLLAKGADTALAVTLVILRNTEDEVIIFFSFTEY
ncbi:hypothetical protein E2C01_010320 [Portunus trituberculatus]|uniref:Uncharacterized protein n=1 Tax=Portunus trituberculatus TaxID=210409 RepID=A0A5B7D8B0_PORTR|nr:hypothetical protein [Portunus trituberculatus]